MPNHRHVIVQQPGDRRNYTRPTGGGDEFRKPRRHRHKHAEKLKADVQDARQEAEARAQEAGHVIRDICLEVIGEEGFPLKVESLDARRRDQVQVELRCLKIIGGVPRATIYVPEGKLKNFVRKFERYEQENTRPSERHPEGRPKNEDLVAGISAIRFPVLHSFWTDDEKLYPASETERIWWEVWVRVGPEDDPDEAFAAFSSTIADSEIRVSEQVIRFPERLVFLAFGSPRQWIQVFIPLLDRLAELRRAKEIPTEFLRLAPSEQRQFVDDLASRLALPPEDAPAVCLLDYGVHVEHPLLRPLIADSDAQALDPDWAVVDHAETHGTEMAGLAVFGDGLPALLANNEAFQVMNRLESVRIFHTSQHHDPKVWGFVTQEGLAKAEIAAPERRRVACLAATSPDNGRDLGRPTSWSAAIDQHAVGYLDGQRRLYVLAAGNVLDIQVDQDYVYPDTNIQSRGIEDPGQSWNALTVGAFTDRVQIRSPDFAGYQPLAPRDGLCPTSRTSVPWDGEWPLKPDIVMEGGNYARAPGNQVDGCDDLALLTTFHDSTGRLLNWVGDTSAATAQAARLAAILMADYPELWPETIRGLLVHSAEWKDEMLQQVTGDRRADCRKRLRCFGYGVPNLQRARYTVENCVSLVHQGTIQPFKLVKGQPRTNQFVLHSLPWPVEVLEALHEQEVTVRITLSYFIEPNPACRGWETKFRYQSYGLRFFLRGPDESERAFRRRISTQEWEEGQARPSTSDPIKWQLNSRLWKRGSVHSDWWTTTAAELARCGQVAVYPVTGWWYERKHLGRVESEARYSLIITISTDAAEVDLYTPIAQSVGLVTEIET